MLNLGCCTHIDLERTAAMQPDAETSGERESNTVERSRQAPSRPIVAALSRWWSAPSGSGRPARRRMWGAVAFALIVLVSATAAMSAWSYWDLSLPISDPASDMSQMPSTLERAHVPRPSGLVLWTYDAVSALRASPTVLADMVYLVEGQTPQTGRVTALGLSDGSVAWSRSLGSISDHSPAAAGDMVFTGSRSGLLIALDRRSGETVWEFDMGASAVGAPIVADGVLYSASDRVYALDALTGEERWRNEVGGGAARGLALSGEVVAAIGGDGDLNMIDAWNGARRLTFPLWFGTSAAAIASGRLVVAAGDGERVQTLDLTQRDVPGEKALRYWWTKLWLWGMAPRPPLPRGYAWQHRGDGGVTSYPLGADGERVYLAVSERDGSGAALALDLEDGAIRWRRRFETAALAPAVETARTLLIGEGGGTIVELDKESGEPRWEYRIEAGMSAAPSASAEGVILVPTADGRLLALRRGDSLR